MIRNAIFSCLKGKTRFLNNLNKDDSVEIFLTSSCIQIPESYLMGIEMDFPPLNTDSFFCILSLKSVHGSK